MRDFAPEMARVLVEGLVSAFDAGGDLKGALAERWPAATPAQIERAIRIFIEIRIADGAFAVVQGERG